MVDCTIKKKLRFNDHLTFNESHILYDCIEKLEQIEQIYRQWSEIGENADCWAFKEIREVLEQE